MAAHTKIEWCDHSLSPWWGCTKVSPGCAHCYAEGLDIRWKKGAHWGKGAPRLLQPNFEANALELDRKAAKRGHRVTVFPSMCDPFDPEVPIEWFADFLDVIRRTEHLTWLLLTKRPEYFLERVSAAREFAARERRDHKETGGSDPCALCALSRLLHDWLAGSPPANVWIGTSIEDQTRADQRIPHLLRIPAAVRFLSCEPLLGPIDLNLSPSVVAGGYNTLQPYRPSGCTAPEQPRIDWVIVGGESGPAARPMHPSWARRLREECAQAGVPFFFKQWGEWHPCEGSRALGYVRVPDGCPDGATMHHFPDGQPVVRVGKSAAGRRLDGLEHSAFPNLVAKRPALTAEC